MTDALTPQDLPALVAETFSHAPLHTHRGRLQTVKALKARVAELEIEGWGQQQAQLELNKLIARNFLLQGLPCDLPGFDAEKTTGVSAWDTDLQEERLSPDFAPTIFTRRPGLFGWLAQFKRPPAPPGAQLGNPSDTTTPEPFQHLSRTVQSSEGIIDYHAAWRYDPACQLMLNLACGGRRQVRFETRCDSFRHALEHLHATLEKRGMTLALMAFSPGAQWADSAADCETLNLSDGRVVHGLALSVDPPEIVSAAPISQDRKEA
ncbi:hypothetical protein [Celeribacter sp. ULVN23_4]